MATAFAIECPWRWPDPRQLRRADRRLIRHVLRDHSICNEEQQKEIIDRIRSAQLLTSDDALITPAAMAVKLLANQIQQAQKAIGEFDAKIAEAMKQHPKFLRQTFHEFADSARIYCPWTKARYRMLRDRGMKHHAAIRKLARSWIRILFRVWQTEVPFDCDRYIAQLKQRCPEITRYLAQEN